MAITHVLVDLVVAALDDTPLPIVDIYLNTDLYEHIERAFVMPNPQIKFRLEFKQSIQYEGFTLTFNKPIENFEGFYERPIHTRL